ncbi:carbohydrate ABC transporter permease [Marinactinospora thermotolerans]|uniref:Carbohydrate ABC transporter membrane protein 2, CUT1 family (TC 3.A.1.1.-) n=1 Tax=Marinactinospora thermotolerans DSM 45154 TaxID=1122192 RepID=A0A1T4JXT7_9ACTN|nr:carbohydrate ABC transporter permease [Marinactinospora thermotolerans]SJZ35010.1 carbohydrate ABC transporter membrane protein 2, CUT1 family (TC 3.A.1.1.-) [Marinactinospora thermotolerans DSM 45154]
MTATHLPSPKAARAGSGAPPAPAPRPRRRRGGAGGLALTLLTWAVTLVFVAPALWMVLTSFKQEADAYTDPPRIFFEPTLDRFREVFAADFAPYLGNSLMATLFSTTLVLVLGVPAAYALSVAPVRKTKDVLFFFISTKMLPVVAVIVPLYVIAGRIKMLDNIWTLVILYTAMNLPIAVWMLRSFFLEVPRGIVEAARMEGASLPRVLWSVMLPVMAPGIAATALICMIFSWNEFFFAVNLTASQAATVPVFMTGFITSEGLYWAQLSAAATMVSLPIVIVGWIAQRQLVRGLSMGAVK